MTNQNNVGFEPGMVWGRPAAFTKIKFQNWLGEQMGMRDDVMSFVQSTPFTAYLVMLPMKLFILWIGAVALRETYTEHWAVPLVGGAALFWALWTFVFEQFLVAVCIHIYINGCWSFLLRPIPGVMPMFYAFVEHHDLPHWWE